MPDLPTAATIAVPWTSFSAKERSKSDSGLLSSAWRRSVQNVIAETDAEQVLPLLYAAEDDLWNRWEDMAEVQAHDDERTAMNSAAVKLYAIKIQVLGWAAL
jgi:hypothetical protein